MKVLTSSKLVQNKLFLIQLSEHRLRNKLKKCNFIPGKNKQTSTYTCNFFCSETNINSHRYVCEQHWPRECYQYGEFHNFSSILD